jgi:cytochrome c-type biogenesis protein CcmH
VSARAVLIGAALVTLAAVAWSARPMPLSDAERVDRITSELRCPVCQGLSVKDSPSDTARQMRDLVVERVAQGASDDEIRAEFQRSYGDWVLLAPPLGSPGGLVWLVPLAAVALGGVLAWRRARAPSLAPATAPAEADLAALRERVRREEALEP